MKKPTFRIGERVVYGPLGEYNGTVRAILINDSGIKYQVSYFKTDGGYEYQWIDGDELDSK